MKASELPKCEIVERFYSIIDLTQQEYFKIIEYVKENKDEQLIDVICKKRRLSKMIVQKVEIPNE